jgi:hypothetical protein
MSSGLPDGTFYFQTKNPNLGKFLKDLQWKMLLYFMTIGSILRQLGIFLAIWSMLLLLATIFPVLVCCTYQ